MTIPSGRTAKQVIVIRRDLGMGRGKEIAQGAHASMAFLAKRLVWVDNWGTTRANFTPAEYDWLHNRFTKITCQVPDLAALTELDRRAREAGLESHLITDAGFTVFGGVPTVTALAIGPAYEEQIGPITGSLKLY
jgi:PTH2 family peptidyl-tRNA hydrolase